MDKCASFNYDVKTHKCSLMANSSAAMTDRRSAISGRYVKESDQHANRLCRTRPCKPDQVCVEMTSGNGYICLQDLFTSQAPTSYPTCEVPPPIEHMTSERFSSDLPGAKAFYTCDTGFRETSGSGHSVCAEDGRWTRPTLVCEVVDCGTPPDSSIHRVEFVDTTYQSNAVYQCGLGYIPSTVTSVCRANGTWSPTCQGIPNLRGTNTLEASFDMQLQCRNVQSAAIGNHSWQYTSCMKDEILIGCSAVTEQNALMYGSSLTSDLKCAIRHTAGAQSFARCCKIPGIRCEYLRSVTSSPSCYKGFQLLDCSCFAWSTGGHCQTTLTNMSCTSKSNKTAFRYATCCTHDQLSCYVKQISVGNARQDVEVTTTCGLGETMTECSAFKTSQVQKAVVEVRNGVDTCVIDPGTDYLNTLNAYASCCKVKY